MKKDKNMGIVIILLVIIIIILTSLIVLFATDKITFNFGNNDKVSTEKNNDDSSETDSDIVSDNDSNITISNDDIYASIITEYRNAINDTSFNDDYSDVSIKYKNVNERMVIFYHIYNKKDSTVFQYAYYDIDKNGNDELIISEFVNDTYSLIDVFSYNGTNPVKLIDEYSLGDRSSLQIWSNGVLKLKGSTGAYSGMITFSRIASDGYGNEVIKNYHYQIDEQNNVSFYTKLDETGAVVEESKTNYSSFDDVENVHLSGASVVDISTLNWNRI